MNFKLSLKSILFILSAIFPFALVANDNWAQVRIPVACIRDGKGHSTEMTLKLLWERLCVYLRQMVNGF